MRKSLLESKAFLITALMLSLPILLFVYQPSWQLGGLGMILGVIGMTLSPLLLFGILMSLIVRIWRS